MNLDEGEDGNLYDQVRVNYERRFGVCAVTPSEYPEPPFSRGRVTSFLEDDGQLDAVKWVVKWQMGWNTSHFAHALQEAIVYADIGNLSRLAAGFPDEVMGFLAWRVGNLAAQLDHHGILDKGW